VTEESSESATGWTPEPAPAARGALLRSATESSEVGRYSVQDLSVEYVEAPDRASEDESSSPERVETELESNASEREAVVEDPLLRARRFTPKQRPAHRRGRQHETLRNPPSRAKEEHADLLRTLPDRSRHITSPSRPSALRESLPPSAAEQSEQLASTAPAESPLASAPLVSPAMTTPAIASPPIVSPRRPAAITQPLASLDPGPLPQTPPTNPRLAPLARRGSSPPVGPNAITQRLPERANYQPLPKDRAGFEAFMKQRAADAQATSRNASASPRVHWKDQETLLIQRSSLMPMLPTARIGRRRIPLLPIAAVCALVLVAAGTLFLRRQALEGTSVRAVPITNSPSSTPATQAAAVPTTLIATEPSGAELLLGGAVLGNTPVAVARPSSGEETYLLRMTGFEWQLVRISAQSGGAIRVTMRPLGQKPPPSAAP
jgi:hypothetical protein